MKIVQILFSLMLMLNSVAAFAVDSEDATRAANDILSSLHSRNFDDIWRTKTSSVYKKTITRDSFMANMALGRGPLGNVMQPPMFVDMGYAKSDLNSGVTGEIYAFNFLTTYAAGRFYERIVVIKEDDGAFRLAGLFGAPAP